MMELNGASSSTDSVESSSSQKDNSQSYNSHTLFKAEPSPWKSQTLFSNSCQGFGGKGLFFKNLA